MNKRLRVYILWGVFLLVTIGCLAHSNKVSAATDKFVIILEFSDGTQKKWQTGDGVISVQNKELAYVYFGSYPQREITGKELTQSIKNAQYDSAGIAVVDGEKIKRISSADATFVDTDKRFEVHYDWSGKNYAYFRFEPIKWRVLKTGTDNVFLLSEDGLDCQRFNSVFEKTDWSRCSLRYWLNGYFFTTAFNTKESSFIIDTQNDNGAKSSSTSDRVFLLSFDEATSPDYGFYSEFFIGDERQCVSSDFATAMGGCLRMYYDWDNDSSSSSGLRDKNPTSDWWLRTMVTNDGYDEFDRYQANVVYDYGHMQKDAGRFVTYFGESYSIGNTTLYGEWDSYGAYGGNYIDNSHCTVRPAINLKLSDFVNIVSVAEDTSQKVSKPETPQLNVEFDSSTGDLNVSILKTAGASGYYLCMSDKEDNGFKKIKTIKKDGTKKRKITIPQDMFEFGTTYYFKVKAYNNEGTEKIYSKYSDTVSVYYSPTTKVKFNDEFSVDLCWDWSLFDKDASEYDHDLAKIALVLSQAAESGKAEIKSRLKSLGFDADSITPEHYDDNEVDRPATCFASKKIKMNGKDMFVIAVVVRGTDKDDTGDKLTDISAVWNGFENSAVNISKDFKEYRNSLASKYGTFITKDNTILFVTGHSLGGAVSGVLAEKFDNKYAVRKNIFVYTFAAPNYNVGFKASSYTNVHNIINEGDLIPYLANNGKNGNLWFYNRGFLEETTSWSSFMKFWEKIYPESLYKSISNVKSGLGALNLFISVYYVREWLISEFFNLNHSALLTNHDCRTYMAFLLTDLPKNIYRAGGGGSGR